MYLGADGGVGRGDPPAVPPSPGGPAQKPPVGEDSKIKNGFKLKS